MNHYLKSCQSEFWKNVFEKELEYILKELKDYNNVLSIGCGPAIIERGLQEKGFNVTGLDVSKEALEGSPDSIRTFIGTAEQMNFADSSFDAVIYIVSLQFIENYEKAVKETARILKPKGKLLVMLLNPESVFFGQRTRNENSYMNKIKHKDLPALEEMIKKYFSVETEYYLGIDNERIFHSRDPKLASLYVIQGIKR